MFTSDAHYGLTRGIFRHACRRARRQRGDGGGDHPLGPLTSWSKAAIWPIARKRRIGRHSARRSNLSQFSIDYIDGLTVKNSAGQAPLYIVPGNHEVSMPSGSTPMRPLIDKTARLGSYNRMMAPSGRGRPRPTTTRQTACSSPRDYGGIHFMLVTIRPDSIVRLDGPDPPCWRRRPLCVQSHQPEAQAKTTNPNGARYNAVDRFENLLASSPMARPSNPRPR